MFRTVSHRREGSHSLSLSLLRNIHSHNKAKPNKAKPSQAEQTSQAKPSQAKPSRMNQLVASLCQSARGILHHKTTLLDVLVAKHGPDDAVRIFTTVCPVVHASLGQHLRHSMDHMERAVVMAKTMMTLLPAVDVDPQPKPSRDIHYDLRQRGGMDEHDLTAARHRIQSVDATWQDLSTTATNPASRHLFEEPVQACFVLSGTTPSAPEVPLPSTVARELGFATHHAIHHLALMRIIAIQTAGLSAHDLPSDFGKAPSTLQFEAANPPPA